MPKIEYVPKNFMPDTLAVIDQANRIIGLYEEEGTDLTLRQLYYQFVARDVFPEDRRWSRTDRGKWVRDPDGTKNAEPNYKWLGAIISDARLAGLVDWNSIEDRTRNLQGNSHWNDPGEIIRAASRGFQLDHWEGQEFYVEVWIEKEALVGVISRLCRKLDVHYYACKGYVSLSEMWSAAQRLMAYDNPVIIHLGDHDPSGIDMTRDIGDRNHIFENWDIIVDRIALNMDQVEKYNPPPNPAKTTDSRGTGYIKKYGENSWELDALEPSVLRHLIEERVKYYRDEDLYREVLNREKKYKEILNRVEENWETL